jgi:F-type H+-transporting ATPase subunit delta
MNYSAISVRYSKALYQLAREKNIIDDVYSDILTIQKLINEIQDFQYIIENPVIPTQTKINIADKIFKNQFHEVTYNFIVLIFRNKRDKHLPLILRNFVETYKSEKGIKTLVLKTAVKIDEKLKEKFSQLIETAFHVKPEFKEIVDEDIIGGFILRVDDRQIDSSIATRLKMFKKELIR